MFQATQCFCFFCETLYMKRIIYQGRIENFDGDEISFSFLIGSLFPDAWKNIQQALKDEHMRGYLEAKEEED